MTRLIIVTAAAIGLILFVAFIASRLLRTRTRGMSIRMQVFLALALIIGAFAFGLGLMVIDRVEARAVRLASQAARDEASSIAQLVEGQMDRTDTSVRQIAGRFEQERRGGADLRLELLDADGQVLFPARGPSARGEPGTVYFDAPIRHHGTTVGAVRVVKPTIVMRRLLEDFAPTVLVISLILGAAAAVSAALIGRAIARPIEALSAFGERVSAGERTAAPPPPFGREVTRLTRSIDSMRRELEGRPFVETFAADLSHELKNPVAAIRASAEILEEGALDEPEDARRFVARIREATARIERLLGDLVSLAHIEARGTETFDPVDLGEIVRAAVETLPVGAERISVRIDGDARVRGDAAWLGRGVGNLVDNALVHSEPASPVGVEVSRSDDGIVLRVKNQGEVSKHVRKRLFRRFVTTRADKGGSGLGLAIVRAVAESHGGHAELTLPGPPEVEFRIVLPPARRRAASQLRDAVSDAAGEARERLSSSSHPAASRS